MEAVATDEGCESARLRCPCCGSSWSRCRLCSARYALGAETECAARHLAPTTLYCRCGARLDVDGCAVEAPNGRHLALLQDALKMRIGIIRRMRARGSVRASLAWLARASTRHAPPAKVANLR